MAVVVDVGSVQPGQVSGDQRIPFIHHPLFDTETTGQLRRQAVRLGEVTERTADRIPSVDDAMEAFRVAVECSLVFCMRFHGVFIFMDIIGRDAGSLSRASRTLLGL